ncbi:SDR family NAD(P)-dependent oxidoreductase [Streptomyces tsukubensis]|uniref:SDR family NAD(P)-dependent oxidoreductase n=1 Tax=Streptomyces tsukubensis TaxID=83656 RepID=UPI0029C9E689|nr:SDR family NAD(P)-dependent oxidoreductase [Streptomyces tsukubensis]
MHRTRPPPRHPPHTILYGPNPHLIHQTIYTQPALFAFQTALYHLLQHWNIHPHTLAGHSIGEITAAHTAGILTLTDAATLITTRGRLMQNLPTNGTMAAINTTQDAIRPLLEEHHNTIGIAAINGPESLVLSGEKNTLRTITDTLKNQGIRVKHLNVSHAFHSPLMDPILNELHTTATQLTYHPPTIPIISTVTGQPITPHTMTDPHYWTTHARHTVQLHQATQHLTHHTTLEIGPAGTLTPHLPTPAHPTHRTNQPEPHTLTTTLAHLHTHGHTPNWTTYYNHPTNHHTPLPTYPFQHHTYWLNQPDTPRESSPAELGLETAHHPLLSTVVTDPESGGAIFTGRISLASHPWLADHVVGETVLFPGTAFVELALHTGEVCGYDVLDDLTLEAPLPIPEQGMVDIRVTVAPADAEGRCGVYVHARRSDGWARHASATLVKDGAGTASLRHGSQPSDSMDTWPPTDAVPVEMDGVYDALGDRGLHYGTAFQGLRAVWRSEREVFAEVSLPEAAGDVADQYVVHPALLDSVLHAVGLGDFVDASTEGPSLPFAWRRVRIDVAGADTLRVRLSAVGKDTVALRLFDEGGAPMGGVEELTLRSLPVGGAADSDDGPRPSFLRVDWQRVPGHLGTVAPGWWALLDVSERRPHRTPESLRGSGVHVDAYREFSELATVVADTGSAPDTVMMRLQAPPGATTVPEAASDLALDTLGLLQDWLRDDRFRDSHLVVITCAAVATDGASEIDPVMAAVWGMVRAAQSEHPGRVSIVDLEADTADVPWRSLSEVLTSGEPQAAVRAGSVRVPRLVSHPAHPAAEPSGLDPRGTVLVTGAAGALGSAVARHLVSAHGVSHLLLAGRRGERAPEMVALREELEHLAGAEARITVASCDLAERSDVVRLLGSLPPDQRLTAVVHTAGVLDDGVLDLLSPERVTRVLRPKVDASWHLHELTRDLDLSAFVLFSSAAGVLGSAGQANYAAGNTFLDALAAHRRVSGLPGVSLAWGPWDTESGMAGELGAEDRNRLERGGLLPLSVEEGLALFDAALAEELERRAEPLLVSARVDTDALRALSSRAPLPSLWHALVRPRVRPRRSSAANGSSESDLRTRWSSLGSDDREKALLDLVRGEVASVLGHVSLEAVGGDRAFTELGFDSLTAVELRNRLERATGLKLSATVVFDQPTPPALTSFLHSALDRLHAAHEEEDASGSPATDDGFASKDSTVGGLDTLGEMFRQACSADRIEEGMELVRLASHFRTTFEALAQLEQRPHPVPLARGTRDPLLICFPAVVAMSGAHQYARFAAALRDSRDTVVLPQPGFLDGELLPGSIEALVDMQARAALEYADGAPFAVLGYSSGGWIAHAVADRLEKMGHPARAAVMVDTYLAHEMTPRLQKAFTQGLFARREQFVSMDHVSLTAMAGYFEVFGAWEPRPLSTPTLFVRAANALPDSDGSPLADADWGPTWSPVDASLKTPGDHFTVMEEHADSTARAVDEWFIGLDAPGSGTGA